MKRTFPIAVALAAVAFSGSVRAQEDASSVAAARAVGVEGMKLAEAGNCRAAVDKLERAEKLRHAPTTLEALGTCHVKLGHLVVGTEMLQRVVREPLAPDAPAAFSAARTRAQAGLDEARPRIAQLRVAVEAPPGVQPLVKVDGEPVPAALLDLDRPTDPGTHTVEVSAPGYRKATSTVTLKEGEHAPVRLVLEVDPNAPVPVAISVPPPAPARAPDAMMTMPPVAVKTGSGTGKTLGIVLVGVGAAGLVTGGVFGLLATGTKSDLDGACVGKACPPGRESDIRTLDTQSTVSTIGFVAGGILLAGGAILLLTSSSSRTAVSAGLGSLRLGGHF